MADAVAEYKRLSDDETKSKTAIGSKETIAIRITAAIVGLATLLLYSHGRDFEAVEVDALDIETLECVGAVRP